MQHFITFKKNEFENVLKQYLELQEQKETIHIFCDYELKGKLLDKKITVLIDNEFKFIRFNNHIFKYKVEFHDEYSFNAEMKHVICFIDNDDESKLELIRDLKEENLTKEANLHIIVKNVLKLGKDEEQEKIEDLKNKYESLSNDFVPISQYRDDVEEYHNLFKQLIKGEEPTIQVKEETCCRI